MRMNQIVRRASGVVWACLVVSLLPAANSNIAIAAAVPASITTLIQDTSEPPQKKPPTKKETQAEDAKQSDTPPNTSDLPKTSDPPKTSDAPKTSDPPKTSQDGDKQTLSDDDVQMFFNPNFADANLPVRREEAWTPPTPIDWSIEGVLELNFDHLKFNIKPDDPFEVRQLTLDLLKLRGRTIKIRGYIRPSFKEKNITRFVFVRDNQECCFGPGAALYDSMIVNMAAGHSVNFSTRPVTIEGRFKLSPLRGPDDRVWAIFELNDTVLK